MRTFYKTIFSIEVLSEEPLENIGLADLAYEITEGHASGGPLQAKITTLDGPTAAQELIAQGSDPEFFMLTPEGAELEESK